MTNGNARCLIGQFDSLFGSRPGGEEIGSGGHNRVTGTGNIVNLTGHGGKVLDSVIRNKGHTHFRAGNQKRVQPEPFPYFRCCGNYCIITVLYFFPIYRREFIQVRGNHCRPFVFLPVISLGIDKDGNTLLFGQGKNAAAEAGGTETLVIIGDNYSADLRKIQRSSQSKNLLFLICGYGRRILCIKAQHLLTASKDP